MMKWFILGLMTLMLNTACNLRGKDGQGDGGGSPDGTGGTTQEGGDGTSGGGTNTAGAAAGETAGSATSGEGTTPTGAASSSHYTLLNDSVDMILHISSGSRAVSIGPGKCAFLKPEDFGNLHVQESNAGWGWYLASGDMLYYEDLCTPEGGRWFSDACPKKAGHYRYSGDDEPLVSSTEQAKDCAHF